MKFDPGVWSEIWWKRWDSVFLTQCQSESLGFTGGDTCHSSCQIGIVHLACKIQIQQSTFNSSKVKQHSCVLTSCID